VVDTSGIVYPYTPQFSEDTSVSGTMNGDLPYQSFVMYREKFLYNSQKQYNFTTSAARNEVRMATAPLEFPVWQSPEWVVDTACSEWEYMVYSIGVGTNTEQRLADYLVTAIDLPPGASCADCLLGTWQLDPWSYLTYSNSLFPSRMSMSRAVGFDGNMFMEFSESGKTLVTFDNFTVFYKGSIPDPQGGQPIQTGIEIKFKPTTAVRYTASDTTINYSDARARLDVKGRMTLADGQTFPFSVNTDAMPNTGLPVAENYVCKGNFLAMIPILPPSVPNTPQPIYYSRYLPPSP
jgi:hypothetical protein